MRLVKTEIAIKTATEIETAIETETVKGRTRTVITTDQLIIKLRMTTHHQMHLTPPTKTMAQNRSKHLKTNHHKVVASRNLRSLKVLEKRNNPRHSDADQMIIGQNANVSASLLLFRSLL